MNTYFYTFIIGIFFALQADADVNRNSDFKDGFANWTHSGGTARIISNPEGKAVNLQGESGRMSIQQIITTSPHWGKYEIILEMKAQGDFTGELYYVRPKTPWTMHYKRQIGKIDSNFKTYKFSVVPKPTETAEPAVFRIVFYGKGNIEIKNIRIIKRPMQPQTSASTSAITSGENLLTGGGFELGDRYYTVGWAGFTRELGGYKNLPEYYNAENGNNSGRIYNHNDKWEGTQALELKHDSKNLRTLLYSEPAVTGSSQVMEAIFSVYMKAAQEPVNVDIGIQSGILGAKPEVSMKSFNVGRNWQRYWISGKVGRQGQCIIIFKNKGGLLIDAAMFEINSTNKPSDYKPTQNFNCFVKSSVPFGVSFKEDLHTLTLVCINRQKLSGELSAIIKFTDYQGIKVKEMKLKLLDKTVKQSQPLMECKLPVGYYKVCCEIMYNNKLQVSRENAIAIIPNRDISKFEDTPFGAHAPPIARNLLLLKMIGVSMIRTHVGMETKWQVIEPQKGKFQSINNLLEISSKNKLKLLGSLDNTPFWASTIKPDYPSLKKFKMPQDLWYWARIFPPANVDDMLNYVKHTVKEYSQYIQYWETWNEVHLIEKAEDRIKKPIISGFIHLTLDELLSQSKQIYETIKKINPEILVVGQYACKAPYDQFDKIINAGGLKYTDKLAVHFYQGLGKGTPPDEPANNGYTPLCQQVSHWRQLMKNNGKTVGLWDTEFGICRIRSNYKHWKYLINWEGCTQQRTVAYIVKSYLVKMSLGFEKIFYYTFGRPSYVYSYNPFIEFDCRPQPGIVAFAVMTKLFTDAKFYPDLVDDKFCHIIKARNQNGFIYALWLKSAGANIKFMLRPDKSIKSLNAMGSEIVYSPIKITEEPIYIQSSDSIDKLLVSSYTENLSQQKTESKVQEKVSQPDIVNTGL